MVIIKSKREIEGIRKSSQLAASILQKVGEQVIPGITTEHLNRVAVDLMNKAGAKSACLNYRGRFGPFPKEICVSVNNEICHGIPGPRVIAEGDIVKVDITTILDGYFGDTCSTFVAGMASSSAKHLVDVTKKCLEIGIKQVKPGVKTGKIGWEISQYAMSEKCSIVFEYSGHGVGVEFHEPPSIMHICREDDGVFMRPGMTFTIEPMLVLGKPETVLSDDGWTALTNDGSLSAQFEHTILVTDGGYEILSQSAN